MLGGEEWEKQVFDKLKEVEVGVIVLSPDYFERENCKAEYHRMIERWNGGKGDLILLPVKQGRSGQLSIPSEISGLQYFRDYDYGSVSELASALLEAIERLRRETRKG